MYYNVEYIFCSVPEMTKRDSLGELEHIILLALIRLKESAYGVMIREEIAERTGRDISYGAIYTALERLERKGFVTARLGEATPERGGRAKKYFRIDAPGILALKNSRAVIEQMWDGVALPAERVHA